MDTSEAMLSAFLFLCVPAMTWFFSTRPRLFMRVFVPREEMFAAGRQILRRDEFRRGMRLMALLQFVGVGGVFVLIALWYSA
jgi:hypothetical protein